MKKVKGPAAYELTLQCLDFDEDGETFCQSAHVKLNVFLVERI